VSSTASSSASAFRSTPGATKAIRVDATSKHGESISRSVTMMYSWRHFCAATTPKRSIIATVGRPLNISV
jgi:hypothetical protein